MTPTVRDILIKARREIHAATATHANLCDSQALFALDQLITADAARNVNGQVSQADIVAALEPDAEDDEATRDTEKLPARPARVKPPLTQAEREELERLRKEKAQDSAIINGLRAKLEGRQ
jgi:hypothetical protein